MKVVLEGRKIKASDCFNCNFCLDSLVSLHSQILVRSAKKGSVSSNIIGDIMSRMQCDSKKNVSLVDISRDLGIGSYRAAKLVITFLCGKDVTVANFIENPDLISDHVIRQNIMEGITNDPLCSLEVDQMKECTGIEFEALLLQQLQARNMCFETEAELRNRGKPKTPDILLLIPMGILNIENDEHNSNKNQQLQHQKITNGQRPCVINWIDSKGMFADEETFEENYAQLKSYVNRYVYKYFTPVHQLNLADTDKTLELATAFKILIGLFSNFIVESLHFSACKK